MTISSRYAQAKSDTSQSTWSFSLSKVAGAQDHELEQPPGSSKGHQLLRLLGQGHLPVAFTKIDCGQIFCLPWVLHEVVNPWSGV